MKCILIRTCQITFIAAVALLYVVRALGLLSSAWQNVSEVNTTFVPTQREQLRDVTRTIGDDRVVFLFQPDKHFILYHDEQGAEHIVHDRLHLPSYDEALDFYYDEEDIPTLKEKTLSPSPNLTAALNALRQMPPYPLSLRDRISLTFDIVVWHIKRGLW